MSELSFAQVGEILRLLHDIDAAEVTVEWGDLRIHVRRGGDRAQHEVPRTDDPVQHETRHEVRHEVEREVRHEEPDSHDANEPESSEATPEHWTVVEAPMVGTFYRAPKPGEPPFAEVGDPVQAGDTVALIEVMKLFTELKAETTGKVSRIDAADGDVVEFGQPLLWIEPA